MKLTGCRVVLISILLLMSCGLFFLRIKLPVMLDKLVFTKLVPTADNDKPPPAFATVKFYFFEIVNPDGFVAGEKPVLRERGPYCFKVIPNNQQYFTGPHLLIKERKIYHFLRNISAGSLDDSLTVIDPVIEVASQKFGESFIIDTILRAATMKRTLTIKLKIREMLFDGYVDGLASTSAMIGMTKLVNGKVGFLVGKNNTFLGTKVIRTGSDGAYDKMWTIEKFDGQSNLPYYGSACNALYGTDGGRYPPSLQPLCEIQIFNDALCRPWPLHYSGTSMFEGFEMRQYVAQSDFLAPTGDKVLDKCYEKKSRRGFFDASICLKKPVLLSAPHFFNSDPKLIDEVVGMHPEASKHQSRVSIHKYGVPLDLHIRIQINFPVRRHFEQAGEHQIIFPIFWQEMMLDEDARLAIVRTLREQGLNLLTMIETTVTLLAFGLLFCPLLLIAIFICVDCIAKADMKEKPHEFQSMSIIRSTKNRGKWHVVLPPGYDLTPLVVKPPRPSARSSMTTDRVPSPKDITATGTESKWMLKQIDVRDTFSDRARETNPNTTTSNVLETGNKNNNVEKEMSAESSTEEEDDSNKK